MQYQFNERFEYVKSVEFKNSQPLLNVDKIRFFKEEGVTGRFTKKEFRYSFDNAVWTNWNTLTQKNLANIEFRDRPNFYLHVKYSRNGIGSGNIQRWYVFFDSTTPTPPTPPVDASIDADTLKGEGPEYYLDRENHTGPFTALNVENVSDPSAIGVYYERVDGSFGTTLRFKSIVGDNGITVHEQDGIITIDGSALSLDVDHRLDVIDASIVRIDLYQGVQDASIAQLMYDVSILDPSNFASEISRLSQDVSPLWNRADSVDSSITRIDGDTSILQGDVSSLWDRVDSVDASLVRIDSSLNLVYSLTFVQDTSIGLLTQWQAVQDSSIEILRGRVETIESSIIRIDSDVSSLWDRADSTDASIIRIDGDVSSLWTRSDSLDASIIRIDGDVSTLWDKTESIDSSLSDIRGDISTLQYDVSLIQYDISRLDIEQSVQDASITDLRTRLDLADASLTQIHTDVSSLWTRADSVDASIVRLDAEQGVQDASIERIDTIIDSIEASIALIVDDEVINIGDGSISIYSSRDASRNILLKTIDQKGPVFLTQDNSTILIDSSLVKLYDTSLGADTSLGDQTFMPYSVGGIPVETSVGALDRQTYTKLIDELLFPTTDPCIIEPSSTFDISTNSLHEVDENLNVWFNATFDKGEIKVGDVFQDYRSGDPSAYVFFGPGFTEASIHTDLTFHKKLDIDLSSGLQTFSGYVIYHGGNQPYNNKGTYYGTALPDGSTSVKTFTIEGTYPLFSNSLNINIMTKALPLKSMLTGDLIELSFAAETGGNKQMFDIAKEWVDVSMNNRPIQGIQTFNSLGDDWEYQGGNQATSLSYWDVSTTIRTVQGQPVDYMRYTYNGVDRANAKIRLVF